VMSFYTMAFFGMAPFGSLTAGAIGQRWSAPIAVRIGGVVTIVAVLFFFRAIRGMRDKIRPLYVKLGIIPEVAEGMRHATEIAPPTGK
ncbi:MAG: MFS transporter, partial [Polyangiaceae bacterium]